MTAESTTQEPKMNLVQEHGGGDKNTAAPMPAPRHWPGGDQAPPDLPTSPPPPFPPAASPDLQDVQVDILV